MEFRKIIGLKIVAIKSYRHDMRRKKNFSPDYILFDDEKTYIEIDAQDSYAYHDFDPGAVRLSIWRDPDRWKAIMNDKKHFVDSDKDVGWWY